MRRPNIEQSARMIIIVALQQQRPGQPEKNAGQKDFFCETGLIRFAEINPLLLLAYY
jgi:hypothetical protein